MPVQSVDGSQSERSPSGTRAGLNDQLVDGFQSEGSPCGHMLDCIMPVQLQLVDGSQSEGSPKGHVLV
jgi:hypothetical protein